MRQECHQSGDTCHHSAARGAPIRVLSTVARTSFGRTAQETLRRWSVSCSADSASREVMGSGSGKYGGKGAPRKEGGLLAVADPRPHPALLPPDFAPTRTAPPGCHGPAPRSRVLEFVLYLSARSATRTTPDYRHYRLPRLKSGVRTCRIPMVEERAQAWRRSVRSSAEPYTSYSFAGPTAGGRVGRVR